MNSFRSFFKPLMWSTSLLLAALMAGCGSDNNNPAPAPPGGGVSPPPAGANPAAVGLLTAGDFAILAKTGIVNTPTSVVTGDMGVTPVFAASITGFALTVDATNDFSTSAQVTGSGTGIGAGRIYAPDYTGGQLGSNGLTPAKMSTAQTDLTTAYNDAAGRTATSAAHTDLGAGTLTSLTLTRGVYEWGSAVTIPTDLTLEGSATDVWIFKVNGALSMAAAKNVVLAGGALPKNVFWQVTGAVTIGANTNFKGIILGATGITFGNAASINGRLLAQTLVTLNTTTVTEPAP